MVSWNAWKSWKEGWFMVMDCFMELMEVVEGRGVHGHELLHGTHGSRGRYMAMNCFMELMEVVEGRVEDWSWIAS
jgi:hypothetical protein